MKLLCRLSLLFCATLLLAACSPFGEDNSPPPSPLVSFTPTTAYVSLWSADVGDGDNENYLRFNIAYDQGRLFTTDANGDVIATDANTGKRIWRKKLETAITSGVGLGQGLVLVGAADGQLYALDEHSGAVRWSATLGNQALAVPTVAKNTVLVKTVDDQVYALNAQTGKTVWVFANGAPQMILRFGSSPKVVEDKVIIGTADGKVFAVSLASGIILWQQQIAIPQGTTEAQQMVDIDVNPVIRDGVIYIATYQGNIAALQLGTGMVIWQKKLSSYTGIALGNDDLFITNANSHLWVYSKTDGAVQWQQDELAYRNITAPVLNQNYVVVGDEEGYLHVLSRSSGQFAVRIFVGQDNNKGGDPILSAPVVDGNTIYVLTRSGNLFAYKLVPVGTKNAQESQVQHNTDAWPVAVGVIMALVAALV